jgi:hypothetical protein
MMQNRLLGQPPGSSNTESAHERWFLNGSRGDDHRLEQQGKWLIVRLFVHFSLGSLSLSTDQPSEIFVFAPAVLALKNSVH